MMRNPLPPPFPVGARVRYTGTRRTYVLTDSGAEVPTVEPGLTVTIEQAKPGRKGTGRPLPGEWDGEEPPIDETRDGYSVYRVPVPGSEPYGRIIWPADAAEWERVQTP